MRPLEYPSADTHDLKSRDPVAMAYADALVAADHIAGSEAITGQREIAEVVPLMAAVALSKILWGLHCIEGRYFEPEPFLDLVRRIMADEARRHAEFLQAGSPRQ